jgi:hypothetical protein
MESAFAVAIRRTSNRAAARMRLPVVRVYEQIARPFVIPRSPRQGICFLSVKTQREKKDVVILRGAKRLEGSQLQPLCWALFEENPRRKVIRKFSWRKRTCEPGYKMPGPTVVLEV